MSRHNLYLIRHGQSIYNLENRFTGWKDVELTEFGERQATPTIEKREITNNLTSSLAIFNVLLIQVHGDFRKWCKL